MAPPRKASSVALTAMGVAIIAAAVVVAVLSPPWRPAIKDTLVMRVDVSRYAKTESSQPQARPLAHPRVTVDPPPHADLPEVHRPHRRHPVATRPERGPRRPGPAEPTAAKPKPAEPTAAKQKPAEPAEPAEPAAKAPPKPRVPAVGLVPERRKPAIGIVDEKKGD